MSDDVFVALMMSIGIRIRASGLILTGSFGVSEPQWTS